MDIQLLILSKKKCNKHYQCKANNGRSYNLSTKTPARVQKAQEYKKHNGTKTPQGYQMVLLCSPEHKKQNKNL